jgi:membrane protein implicated in regulation of membrane protease activity
MNTHNQMKDENANLSAGAQLYLVIGFIIFITGVFSMIYAGLASFLLPLRLDFLTIALSGFVATYIGRRIVRKGNRLGEVAHI